MPNNSASFLNIVFIYINTVYNISDQESVRTKRAISSTHRSCARSALLSGDYKYFLFDRCCRNNTVCIIYLCKQTIIQLVVVSCQIKKATPF